jgi:glutamate 5-kinase
MKQVVVIKIGTSVITTDGGELDTGRMQAIVRQIRDIARGGTWRPVIISSGAVGAAHNVELPRTFSSETVRRQVLAAIGQTELMRRYCDMFAAEGMICGQVLATKADFRDRHHYLHMRNCLEGMLHQNVVPVINENDSVAVTELMFTDNDELAGLTASMLSANALILATTTDGVLDGIGNTVAEISYNDTSWRQHIATHKSTFGRGGMRTKVAVAQKCSGLGIPAHIVNGARQQALVDALNGKVIGTSFPARKAASSTKRWLAHETSRGEVYVDEKAAAVLMDETKAVSLLPVGITKVNGEFSRDAAVAILNPMGQTIGIGQARYGSETLEKYLGKKGKEPFIHYDYLWVNFV